MIYLSINNIKESNLLYQVFQENEPHHEIQQIDPITLSIISITFIVH